MGKGKSRQKAPKSREHRMCEKQELSKLDIESKGGIWRETMWEEEGRNQVIETFKSSKPHQGIRLCHFNNRSHWML